MHDPTVPPGRLKRGHIVTRREALNAARTLLTGAVAFSLLPSSAPALAQGDNDVKIVNKSKWEIHHFFLSSTDKNEWGPDQLGEEVIGTGESFTLKNIPCDVYDVKLVDEDGDECVAEAVDICGSDQGWLITDEILLACQRNDDEKSASQRSCPTA